MKCSDVQEKLSAFYDGELSEQVHKLVATHLVGCDDCAAKLAQFESVSSVLLQADEPLVSQVVWKDLEAKLDEEAINASAGVESKMPQFRGIRPEKQQQFGVRRLALAASIFLLIGSVIWLTGYPGHGDQGHNPEFVAVMDHYLRQFSSDPNGAEQFLLNKYNGQSVNADTAVQLVGYRPAVSQGLPDGYSLASTSVLKMPCCTCVKAVCKRQDGSTLVLFEHDDEKAEWFGDRASHTTMCGDRECCLVQLESSIAATWRHGKRSVTAVGLRDAQEVAGLVKWFDQKVEATL